MLARSFPFIYISHALDSFSTQFGSEVAKFSFNGQGYCYGLWGFEVLWVLIRNKLHGRKILWVFTAYGLP